MNTLDDYNFLKEIISHNFIHAKFLNTLSFLEYTGARKIVKGQDDGDIDDEKLTHMSEEMRHALMFKKYSRKLYPQELKYNKSGVYCFDLSRNYIKNIDHYTLSLIEKSLCYPTVSYIIERRAISLYQSYETILEESKITMSLKSLIKEEEKHLIDMEAKTKERINSATLNDIIFFEEKLYKNFCQRLIKECELDKIKSTSHQYLQP